MRRKVAAVVSMAMVVAGGLAGLAGCGGAADSPKSGGTPRPAAVIEIEVKAGKVTKGGGKHEVKLGRKVVLEILSDSDDEVHVHGYDKEAELKAGTPTKVSFTADVPGVFEVELHHSELELCELQVQ
jgi:hypothetical protein